MGFSQDFIRWVNIILRSAHMSVLINGTPEGYFTCSRGVRQGAFKRCFALQKRSWGDTLILQLDRALYVHLLRHEVSAFLRTYFMLMIYFFSVQPLSPMRNNSLPSCETMQSLLGSSLILTSRRSSLALESLLGLVDLCNGHLVFRRDLYLSLTRERPFFAAFLDVPTFNLLQIASLLSFQVGKALLFLWRADYAS